MSAKNFYGREWKCHEGLYGENKVEENENHKVAWCKYNNKLQ